MSRTAEAPAMRRRRRRFWIFLGLVSLSLIAYAAAIVARRARMREVERAEARAEAAVRRMGGYVPPLDEHSLLDLFGRPRSTSVDLSNAEVGDDDLAVLDEFPKGRMLQLSLGRTRLTDAGLARLVARHPDLITLHIGRRGRPPEDRDRPEAEITDAGLAHLAGLKRLSILGLKGVPITDAGLRHLTRLPELRVLELDDSPIGDEGMATLGGMAGLRWVLLSGTKVTDEGLARLSALPNLEMIDLSGTGTTAEGRRRFSAMRPKVQVIASGR